jgi:hypothetical protein
MEREQLLAILFVAMIILGIGLVVKVVFFSH